MKTDTTTKLLLAALAGALWVIALRPVLTPVPAVAQGASAESKGHSVGFSVSGDTSGVYIIDGVDRKIYRFKTDLGKPTSTGTWP